MDQQLKPKFTKQVIDLLTPYLTTQERRAYIEPWCISYPNLYKQIDWTGADSAFTSRIVHLFLRYDLVESDKTALEYLLEAVRETAGLGDQAKIKIILIGIQKNKTSSQGKAVWQLFSGIAILLAVVAILFYALNTKQDGLCQEVEVNFLRNILNCSGPEVISITFVTQADEAVYHYVPAGEFIMGSSDKQVDYAMEFCTTYRDGCSREWFIDDQPQHTVYLDDYWIMETEVTNKQYFQFMEANGYTEEAYWSIDGWEWRGTKTEPECWDNNYFNGEQQPVVCISWYEAEAYANWISTEIGWNFGLPTEAQWEKAARGTDGRLFPWGNQWDGNHANYCDKNCTRDFADRETDDGFQYPAPVGNYLLGVSPYGAFDMAGNVSEWTADWYSDDNYYTTSPSYNPTGPINGKERVRRGGAWYRYSYAMLTTHRFWSSPDFGLKDVGFRLVRHKTAREN